MKFSSEDVAFLAEAEHEDMEGCFLVNGKDDYTALDV